MVDQLKSRRLEGIGEYYFSKKLREVQELKNSGVEVINLGIGSPDLQPPETVKKALVDGMNESDFHQYQSYKGIPALREAFAAWYQKHYKVRLNPDSEILPLIGSKEGIMHICMAFLNIGDVALIPDPGYPTYGSAIKLAGGIPVRYELAEENDFEPDWSELEQMNLEDVKLMFVNYPHMPTGTQATNSLFEKLKGFCKKHNIIIINDNPYSFILADEPKSILSESMNGSFVLELNSLSKTYNMAGWRIGALSGNAELIQQVLTFKSNMDSGMFKPIMMAAVEALRLDSDWFQTINAEYGKRKEYVMEVAKLLGCSWKAGKAGMFLWAKIPESEESGTAFSDKLLNEYDLFVPPGSIFGSQGERYIRFSLCSPVKVLEKVKNRIKEKISEYEH